MSVCANLSGLVTSQSTFSACTASYSIIITNCIFNAISVANGPIYGTATMVNYSINESLFYNCYSTGTGGGAFIYYAYNEKICRNCFYNCSAPTSGAFLYLYNSYTGSHIIDYNTFFGGNGNPKSANYLIYLYYANQIYNRNNMSNIVMIQHTALIAYNPISFTGSYNTFASIQSGIILYPAGSSCTLNLSFTNFYNNTDNIKSWGLLYISSPICNFIEDAFISNNFPNLYIWYQGSVYPKFMNCIFDQYYYYYASVLYSYKSTLPLLHLNTYLCAAQLVAFGSTPFFTGNIRAYMMNQIFAIAYSALASYYLVDGGITN